MLVYIVNIFETLASLKLISIIQVGVFQKEKVIHTLEYKVEIE